LIVVKLIPVVASITMLFEELLLYEILPRLSLTEIRNFCSTSSQYLPLLYDEVLWKIKCIQEHKDLYPRNSLNWREHYFNFFKWWQLPLYNNGDVIGNIYFQPETQYVFPPAEQTIVLVHVDQKTTPLLKIRAKKWTAQKLWRGKYPLVGVNRAVVMNSVYITPYTLRLAGSPSHLKWYSSNRFKLRQYQGHVRDKLISSKGTLPIYGYYSDAWTGEKYEKEFVLIDNRNGLKVEQHIDDFTDMELSSCEQSLGCSSEKIIEELERRGHLLGYDWGI